MREGYLIIADITGYTSFITGSEFNHAQAIIEEQGLVQVSDTTEIDKLIDEVIAANPQQLASYRSGKEALFGFFVGQVIKASKGKANPRVVNERLLAKLPE